MANARAVSLRRMRFNERDDERRLATTNVDAWLFRACMKRLAKKTLHSMSSPSAGGERYARGLFLSGPPLAPSEEGPYAVLW